MAATAKDPWVWDMQRDELLLVASRLLAARLSASASGDPAESRKIATETKACIELAAMLLDGESVMKANSAATAGEWDKQHA